MFGYLVGGLEDDRKTPTGFCQKLHFLEDTLERISSTQPRAFGIGGNGIASGVALGGTGADPLGGSQLNFQTDTWALLTKLLENSLTEAISVNSPYGIVIAGGSEAGKKSKFWGFFDLDSMTYSKSSSQLNNYKSAGCGFGNSIKGFTACGRGSDDKSTKTVYKLDYLSQVASITNEVPSDRIHTIGFHSSESGYICGGWPYATLANPVKTIDKFDMTSETAATINTKLSTERYGASSVTSRSSGYICGGSSKYDLINTIEVMDYSTDTARVLSGQLTSNPFIGMGFQSGGIL